jgi:hypothetical protein
MPSSALIVASMLIIRLSSTQGGLSTVCSDTPSPPMIFRAVERDGILPRSVISRM